MTIPPHKLISRLWNREAVILRGTGKDPKTGKNSPTVERVSASRAMALAEAGLIEGVVKGTALKFVRWLHAGAIPDPNITHPKRPEESVSTAISRSRSTAIARTNLGVYREPMRQVSTTSVYDPATRSEKPVVSGEGEITGHCFSFALLRGAFDPGGRPASAQPASCGPATLSSKLPGLDDYDR